MPAVELDCAKLDAFADAILRTEDPIGTFKQILERVVQRRDERTEEDEPGRRTALQPPGQSAEVA